MCGSSSTRNEYFIMMKINLPKSLLEFVRIFELKKLNQRVV